VVNNLIRRNERRKEINRQLIGAGILALVLAAAVIIPQPALAATAAEIDEAVKLALEKLYENSTAAKEISKVSKGVLVFPKILEAGLIVGGQYGDGALLVDGKTVGYYSTVEASYGLQAGAQTYGYTLFFVTDSALEYLDKSAGWELGVGPTLVMVDEGLSKSLTTSTLQDDIYAFAFDQKGLMGGLGLKGSKITKITPSEA
jgi:lipid-binding SYLF domain-containing protein